MRASEINGDDSNGSHHFPKSIGNTSEVNYPFHRSEEMSWHPEEVARHLASLLPPSLSNQQHGSSSSSSSSNQCHGTALLSRGLDSRHVPLLRQLYGANAMKGEENLSLQHQRQQHYVQRLVTTHLSFLPPIAHAIRSQLKEPLILMLLGSAALSLLLGNAADAVSIGIALTIVALVAAIQEYRSEKALERLSELMPHTASVIRDGAVHDHLPAEELVVGDLVLLSTGDWIPADVRIVDSVELSLDESGLTGENHPMHKSGPILL